MRGTILGVYEGRGVLIGPGEQRLEFPIVEWRSPGQPVSGQAVDYVEEAGQARSVFLVPNVVQTPFSASPQSSSVVFGAIAVGCLALGFVIPVLPTIVAFVLGVIGANRARQDNDETGLILSRIGWIGAIVSMVLGAIAIGALLMFVGAIVGLQGWESW